MHLRELGIALVMGGPFFPRFLLVDGIGKVGPVGEVDGLGRVVEGKAPSAG